MEEFGTIYGGTFTNWGTVINSRYWLVPLAGFIPCTVKQNPPGGFLAITRYHSIGEVPGSVEMVPISLPELPKPSRTPGKDPKPIF